ncbi:3-isopropylmalate dehydratase small subunit [Alisedimentitalea sp. MJ-SS2]|uniref:3-isopropylmalate dehydratase small subunit n=1 Tax=Aliisedimentitalea sp. MJ-SS2 TaxID=3049795 RepID=UPI0029076BF0|nr:3-isopropylmalate dehydratase small subunit [Alisedimentitalea sp. MJ-SS2]MDU8925944.1 3-isopropylmalate dehydratase small subunit [Alisedimentitalea sp. MJ-SS2]
MAGWNVHNGTAVSLPQANVDTDQLIPARFMSVPRSEGYGPYLLHDLRRDDGGGLRPDFLLNTCPEASVIVSRRNFGSGSSREAAVYALVDAGIRAVIAPSFGDIFAANAVNNGLLPAEVDEDTCKALEAGLENGPCDIRIDVGARRLTLGAMSATFVLDDSWAIKLINGWDDIDLTRNHGVAIAVFKHIRSQTAPWAWPAAAD